MQVSIGRLRGGFCVYWTDNGTRHRYQLSARTRKEAESEARDVWLARQPRGDRSTVAMIWAAYHDYLGDRPTGKSMGYLSKPVLEHFGSLRPDQITRTDCRAFVALRRKSVKDGTIWTELGYLQSAQPTGTPYHPRRKENEHGSAEGDLGRT